MDSNRSRRKLFAIISGIVIYSFAFYYLVFVDLSPRRVWAQTVGNTDSVVYLPVVSRQVPPTPTFTPTATPSPTPSPTPAIYTGSWKGVNMNSRPVTFTVSADSSQVLSFILKERREAMFCQGDVLAISEVPVSITNSEFSGTYKKGSVATFSYSGKFTSPTTATGTYSMYKWPSECGWTTGSGTWNANAP